MDYGFCLKCTDGEDVVRYIEIPNQNCEDGTRLTLSKDFTSSEEQKWFWDENRIVSSIGAPNFCLAVSDVKHKAAIILRCRRKESIGDNYNVKWVHKDGIIRTESDARFYIGISNDNVVLLRMEENVIPTKWKTRIIISCNLYKQAITCSLNYLPPQHMPVKDFWTIENTICIRKSSDHSYFSVINFESGGHAGLQQIDVDHRSAVFAMFDDGENLVETVSHDSDVEVHTFDNSCNLIDSGDTHRSCSSGKFAIKNISWMTYQEVSFKITGQKMYNGHGVPPKWRCTCWYAVDCSEEWVHIATYERPGRMPFIQQVSSYIKDCNAVPETESHALQRLAEFSETKLLLGGGTRARKISIESMKIKRKGEVFPYTECTFTKGNQEQGPGDFVQYKAFGAVKKLPPCFILSTGGKTGADIFGSLKTDGCVQRTNKVSTHLFL